MVRRMTIRGSFSDRFFFLCANSVGFVRVSLSSSVAGHCVLRALEAGFSFSLLQNRFEPISCRSKRAADYDSRFARRHSQSLKQRKIVKEKKLILIIRIHRRYWFLFEQRNIPVTSSFFRSSHSYSSSKGSHQHKHNHESRKHIFRKKKNQKGAKKRNYLSRAQPGIITTST